MLEVENMNLAGSLPADWSTLTNLNYLCVAPVTLCLPVDESQWESGAAEAWG